MHRPPFSVGYLCSLRLGPPNYIPSLPCTQVPLPFSSAEAPALCTEPTFPHSHLLNLGKDSTVPSHLLPYFARISPQSRLYPFTPAANFPFCVPIPGRMAPPGSDDFPGPPVYPLGHLLVSPHRSASMGASREGSRTCAVAPGPPGSRWRVAREADSVLFPLPGALGEGLAW